jgi:hypothetical protein
MKTKHDLHWTVDFQLSRMINLMKEHSINRDSINWKEFEEDVYEQAAGSEDIQDAHSAIKLALDLLGDQHSMYITNEGRFLMGRRRDCSESSVPSYHVLSDIGLIKIPSFSGHGDEAIQFANDIQDKIREQDSQGLKGWIVDLRHNTGGNMWPMLLGISPLLDTSVPGYFSTNKNFETEGNVINAWECRDGEIDLNLFYGYRLENSYKSPYPSKKVAVLIDRMTMSSGEAVAVAFKGRKDTRFFGRPSCGLATANQQYLLWNGDKLLLSVSYFADRNKNVYTSQVQPDVEISTQYQVVDAAMNWINENNEYEL